jgi:integrase
MNKVEPIRDKSKIEEVKIELLKDNYRNYLLFVLRVNTGLRIGDILKLKVEDLRNQSHILMEYLIELERKSD